MLTLANSVMDIDLSPGMVLAVFLGSGVSIGWLLDSKKPVRLARILSVALASIGMGFFFPPLIVARFREVSKPAAAFILSALGVVLVPLAMRKLPEIVENKLEKFTDDNSDSSNSV